MNTTNTTITAVTTNATSIDLSSTLAKFSVSVKDGKVVSNIVEVKSAMAAKKSELLSTEYVGTREEQMAMIRDAKAAVNKFKDATTKAKTSVKKELMKPFADFEKTANETIKMAEETYDDLNGRYLTLDAERKAEKRAKIRKEYDSIALECGVEEFADALYGLIYDTTWENTASSMKSIKESIKKSCESYVQGLSTLQMIQADDDIRKKALEMFNENLDAVKAMAYITSEMAAKIEAENKKAAVKPIARSEAECKNVEDEAVIKNDVTAESTSNAVSNVTVGDTNDRIVISFLPEDWEMVKEYCEVNDIFYSEK